MTTNTKLSVVTVVLLAASLWAYSDSVSRGDRFARGQTLLHNLNLDEVAAIVIADGDDTMSLQRGEDGFTIAENHDYPARNDAINRFLRDLLDIALEKEVGTSPALAEELEIDPPGDSTTEITLSNAVQQEMVRLRLGKTIADGAGRYVRRMDDEESMIYLTTGSIYLSTGLDSFLQKEIIDVPQTDVSGIEGPDFVLASREEENPMQLSDVPSGKKEKTFETNKLKSMLSHLRFDEALLSDDEALQEVDFARILTIDLKDDTGYILFAGANDDQSYLRIRGRHSIGSVEIALDTPEEELQEKADRLTRADEIEKFNAFHDSWVYEISSFTADKLKLRKADLLEDES